MDFAEKDLENLPKIIGLCSNLKTLDLSYTKGLNGYDLIETIENACTVEQLIFRGCDLNESVLGSLNSKLYLALKEAEE